MHWDKVKLQLNQEMNVVTILCGSETMSKAKTNNVSDNITYHVFSIIYIRIEDKITVLMYSITWRNLFKVK